ncbi:MAG: class I SAM-dependent methyltransferase [Gammaproteobacteria bacterium]|nr:class I SAM-dependent methyltransferase [Gammaproteobacteria bacterium]MCW8987177.1 class I SAM-dependent methyltransferase [Gammaproteobacteria bacterium]
MPSKYMLKIKNKFQPHQLAHDETKLWQEFQLWYTSPLGQQLAQQEKDLMYKYLPDLFGYFLLQCGCPEIKIEKMAGNWLESSRVYTRFCLDYDINQGVSCQTNLAQLPVKSDSIDIVILPHVLEFSAEPHQVLREVERVLIAEGHVVILGFNPWSLWNVFRIFHFWKKPALWNAQFLTAARVTDWLALLGFDLVQRQGYFYQPPIQNENITRKLSFLDTLGQRFWPNLGAGYVLVARKRVVTLTPIRPRWRSQRQVVSNGFEPINRNKF